MKKFILYLFLTIYIVGCSKSQNELIKTDAILSKNLFYKIDVNRSLLTYESKDLKLNNGTIKIKSGNFEIKDNQYLSGRFTANLSKLGLDNQPLSEITFETDITQFLDNPPYNTQIKGKFKLKEVTQNIQFLANSNQSDDEIIIQSSPFFINKSDFIINLSSNQINLPKEFDQIKINIKLVGMIMQ